MIEIHEDFSWEDALAHFLERLRWILKALRAGIISPNSEEYGIQYIKVQCGIFDGKKSAKIVNLED